MSLLPDFLVIGAFKAGTTSLHHYLDKHPRIFMTRLKEPNFFAHTKSDPNHDNRNIFPVTDLAQYERLFADARADQLKGEASPGYLPSKQAPRKIKEQIPDIRLLATLRDPVDRAYSHYLMELRNEQISLPPNQAFDAGGYWLEASNYARQLNRYLEHFRPDQIKVVLYEEMRSDADKVVHDILDWLGLPPLDTLNANEQHNRGGVPRSQFMHRALNVARTLPVTRMIPPGVRRRLARLRDLNLAPAPELSPEESQRWRDYFAEDIERTAQLLDVDLSQWLS
tara:strand:+ start:2935 stop:3780 length:846 start_codon:yes stop_codon:yes gene_type:complete